MDFNARARTGLLRKYFYNLIEDYVIIAADFFRLFLHQCIAETCTFDKSIRFLYFLLSKFCARGLNGLMAEA